jgi:hypothetical protein
MVCRYDVESDFLTNDPTVSSQQLDFVLRHRVDLLHKK